MCLESILNSDYKNIRVFLVDNGSNKKSYLEFLNDYKEIKKVELIRLSRNLGFGGGCNAALRKIKRGYIVFLNNDVTVSRNWLFPIISYMEKDKSVGACQPKIKEIARKDYFEYAGAVGGYMDVFGFPFCRGRVLFTIEKDKGQYDDIADIVWCSGTCLVTKRDVIKKVGFFDLIFFMYVEEGDLCWRMAGHGYRLVSIPKSIIFHHGSATMNKERAYKKIFYIHRNGLIFLIKNYSVAELLRYLPVRIGFDFIAFWFYATINKRIMNAAAVILAYLNLIYLLPEILKSRKKTYYKLKNNPITRPIYKRSIIIDYYLFNKKKFSDLNFKCFGKRQ